MHESMLVYRGFRYLKVAMLLMLVAVVAYVIHEPLKVPNGGTWLGYTLGTIGAVLILWLTWFGVRKRRYGPGAWRLEAWLSAHVYLGLSLTIVATLHTGFQFGWNVHTLAYALMLAVIVSGVFGVYAYQRYPSLMTENRRGLTLNDLFSQIAELDQQIREAAQPLGDEVNRVVLDAAQTSGVGGGVWRQLSGRDPRCATALALGRMRGLANDGGGGEREAAGMRQLVTLLTRKDELLMRARQDVQMKALMDIWLFFHVPLTFALLAALLAHVFSVIYYW